MEWQIRFRVKAACKEVIRGAVDDLVKETRNRINQVIAESPVDIVALLQQETSRIFDSEGIPRWPNLTKQTVEKRLRGRSKKRVFLGKILQRTGGLKKATLGGFYIVRPTSGSTNSFVRFDYEAHPLFKTHHFGEHIVGRTRIKAETGYDWEPWIATIPSRPMLPIGREGQRVGRRIYNEIIIPRLNKPLEGR